jgi:aryl-alcohol dehydrogenase-like predicted oxidoreductase
MSMCASVQEARATEEPVDGVSLPAMTTDFLHTTPIALGKRVHRLGLATNYGIDERGVRRAMERGVNTFLVTGRGKKALGPPLREVLKTNRDAQVVIGFATIGFAGWGVKRAADALRKELGTDYLDVLLLGWLGVGSAWTSGTVDALRALRESGAIRGFGVSIHDRPRAGKLAEERAVDLLMIRYNAAHPGAERDVFPHVREQSPSVLAYTATAWRKLLKRPKAWDGPVMSAGDCYRFQLSSPHVDLALTGPKTIEELDANLDAVEKGALSEDEAKWMRSFGRAVHG